MSFEQFITRSSQAIQNFYSHKVNEVVIDPKDSKETVANKHKLCRQMHHSKKYALQSIFKKLHALGVSYQRGLNSRELMDAQILSLDPLRGMIRNQSKSVLKAASELVDDDVITSCNSQYRKLIASNMDLLARPNDGDLDSEYLHRIHGIALDFVHHVIQHDRSAAIIYRHLLDIQAATTRLQQLQKFSQADRIVIHNYEKIRQATHQLNELVGRVLLAISKLERMVECCACAFEFESVESDSPSRQSEEHVIRQLMNSIDEEKSLMTRVQLDHIRLRLPQVRKVIDEVSYELEDLLNHTSRNHLYGDDNLDQLKCLYKKFMETFTTLGLEPVLFIHTKDVASYLNIILTTLHLKLVAANQLLPFFIDLVINGFGLPFKAQSDNGTDGKPAKSSEENSGFGEGQGETDVSKKLEFESELDELKKNETASDKENETETKDIDANDDAVEMSEDIEASAEGQSRKDEKGGDEEPDDEEQEDLEELDKELDKVDDDEGQLDENLWDDKDEKLDEDNEEDLKETDLDHESKPDMGEEELLAKNEDLSSSEKKEDQLSGQKETDGTDQMDDEEQVEETGADKIDEVPDQNEGEASLDQEAMEAQQTFDSAPEAEDVTEDNEELIDMSIASDGDDEQIDEKEVDQMSEGSEKKTDDQKEDIDFEPISDDDECIANDKKDDDSKGGVKLEPNMSQTPKSGKENDQEQPIEASEGIDQDDGDANFDQEALGGEKAPEAKEKIDTAQEAEDKKDESATDKSTKRTYVDEDETKDKVEPKRQKILEASSETVESEPDKRSYSVRHIEKDSSSAPEVIDLVSSDDDDCVEVDKDDKELDVELKLGKNASQNPNIDKAADKEKPMEVGQKQQEDEETQKESDDPLQSTSSISSMVLLQHRATTSSAPIVNSSVSELNTEAFRNKLCEFNQDNSIICRGTLLSKNSSKPTRNIGAVDPTGLGPGPFPPRRPSLRSVNGPMWAIKVVSWQWDNYGCKVMIEVAPDNKPREFEHFEAWGIANFGVAAEEKMRKWALDKAESRSHKNFTRYRAEYIEALEQRWKEEILSKTDPEYWGNKILVAVEKLCWFPENKKLLQARIGELKKPVDSMNE